MDDLIKADEIYTENIKMVTGGNVFLLTASVSLVSLGVTSLTTDLIRGSIEFVLGIAAFYLYEKFPTTPTA